jgi:hypothetical protein
VFTGKGPGGRGHWRGPHTPQRQKWFRENVPPETHQGEERHVEAYGKGAFRFRLLHPTLDRSTPSPAPISNATVFVLRRPDALSLVKTVCTAWQGIITQLRDPSLDKLATRFQNIQLATTPAEKINTAKAAILTGLRPYFLLPASLAPTGNTTPNNHSVFQLSIAPFGFWAQKAVPRYTAYVNHMFKPGNDLPYALTPAMRDTVDADFKALGALAEGAQKTGKFSLAGPHLVDSLQRLVGFPMLEPLSTPDRDVTTPPETLTALEYLKL